jgi:hypothetical protein
MTYEEFNRQLGRAGLSIRKFAESIKMRGNSISNYSKTGTVPTHLAVIVVLVAKLEELKIDTKELLSKIDIGAKKPRGGGIGQFAGDKRFIPFRKPPDSKQDEGIERPNNEAADGGQGK